MGNLVSTLDVGFLTDMALPMKKTFWVFNEVYLVNHLHDILYYSCKLLVFKYFYRCKGPKNAFGFALSSTIFFELKNMSATRFSYFG